MLKPEREIFIRNLLCSESPELRDEFVDKYAGDCNRHQQQLFRNSLQAAFTIAEVEKIFRKLGMKKVKIYQYSDRHCTAE